MNRAGVLFGLLLMGQTRAVLAADASAKFAWRQPIRGTLTAGQTYRVRISPEIFNASRMFPDDLRIMDESGAEWPYAVWMPKGSTDLQTVRTPAAARGSGATAAYRWQSVSLLGEEAAPDETVAHNEVTIQTLGRDFSRRAEVWGGEDDEHLRLMGEGFLLDFSGPVRVASRSVRYPESRAPVIQVRVYPGDGETVDDVAVGQVVVAHRVEEPGDLQEVPADSWEASAGPPPAGCQEVLLDFGVRNQPVERLTLTAKGEFATSLRISSRNDATNRWRLAGEAEAHRLGADLRDRISLKWFAGRFMRIELYPRDGKPLEGVEVHAWALPRYLVFEAQAGGQPVICCGATGLEPPRYDMGRRKLVPAAAGAPPATLGRGEGQGLQRSVRRVRRWPDVVATAGGVVVVLAAVGFTLRRTRRRSG